MRKLLSGISMVLAVIIALPAVAFAHVVVSPAEAAVGARTTFNVSVPNEKAVNVTGVRVVVPSGVEGAMPTVHAGWTITTKLDDKKNVTEISWTGGTIPEGQRDDFTFRAVAPAKKSTIVWKAYQTYADGTTVAWDQKPTEEKHGAGAAEESSTSGPYSVTEVIDDLATTTGEGDSHDDTAAAATTTDDTTKQAAYIALGASLLAVILSLVAVLKKGNKPATPSSEPTAPTDTNL